MEQKNNSENKEIEYHESITDPNELKILEDFKHSIATITDRKDKAVLNPFVLLDNDFLIHFLRARKLNIKKATKMILDYFHWKAKIKLDYLYSDYIFKEKYKIQLLFPHGFHKTTKEGYPLYFQIMGQLNPDELFKIATPEEVMLYSVSIYEKLERDYFKMCSQIKESYIHGVFNIIDFNGINSSILNKKLISYVKETLKISQDYPESLAGCYVLNASLLFRSFYTTVKVFLDTKTKGKIKVFGTDYKNGLLERIDSKNLPKFFGGECECPGGCLFSNAGPWKRPEEDNEIVPEDILKRRQEITDIMTFGKIKMAPEEQIKNTGKEGVNPDEL